MQLSISFLTGRVLLVASVVLHANSLSSTAFTHDHGSVSDASALEIGWFAERSSSVILRIALVAPHVAKGAALFRPQTEFATEEISSQEKPYEEE